MRFCGTGRLGSGASFAGDGWPGDGAGVWPELACEGAGSGGVTAGAEGFAGAAGTVDGVTGRAGNGAGGAASLPPAIVATKELTA